MKTTVYTCDNCAHQITPCTTITNGTPDGPGRKGFSVVISYVLHPSMQAYQRTQHLDLCSDCAEKILKVS